MSKFLPMVLLMAGPQNQGQQGNPSSFIISLLPFVLIIAVFYLLLIRPQMKKQKEHQAMLSKLEKGDKVLTSGGLVGTVVGVADDIITVRFGENFKAEVNKSYIIGKMENSA